MSAKELKRVEVLGRVTAGDLKLTSAAILLAVSYRQAKRLLRRYRTEGAAGLTHRNAGRPSNRQTPPAIRASAVALIRDKYSGPSDMRFGPTLAAEHLRSEDGIAVSVRRCGGGCWPRDCGVGSVSGRLIGSAASRSRTLASCSRWTAASTIGTKIVARSGV